MKADDSITQRRAGRTGRFGDRLRRAVVRVSRTVARTCRAGDRLSRIGRGLLAAWFLVSSLGLPIGGHAGESCCERTLGVACQCSLKARLAGECCCKAPASKSPSTDSSTKKNSSGSAAAATPVEPAPVKSCCSAGKSTGDRTISAKLGAAPDERSSSPDSTPPKSPPAKPTLTSAADEICTSGSNSLARPRRESTSTKRTAEQGTCDASAHEPVVSAPAAVVGIQEHENQSSGCPSFRACPCGTEAGGIIVLNQQPRLTAPCSTAPLPTPSAELSDSPPASFLSVRTAPPVPPPIVLL